MRLYILILIILVLIIPFSLAANVEGKIYDFSLNIVKNVIVEVNSIPSQKHISLDGSYSFELTNNNYTINVYSAKNELLGSENLTVKEEGSYNLDVILFPNINTDLDNLNSSELAPIEENNNISIWIISVIIILLISFIIFYIKKSKKIKTQILNDDDDLLEEVLEIVKKDSRISQKDLRKHFPLSEAKISLVLTELESKGKIEKIKKGRTNIIIFKK